MKKNISNHFSKHFLAFLFYCFLTIIISWPIWKNFNNTLFGFQNDALGGMWTFWWAKFSLFDLRQFPSTSAYLAAPFGVNFLSNMLNGVVFIYAILTQLFGPLATHNLLVLMSFPLTGLVGYLLAYFFTRQFLPSLVAGLILTLSPYHVTQAESFYNLAQIQWLVFLLLFLFRFEQRQSKFNLAGIIVSFLLVMAVSYHYLIFAAFLILLFFIFGYFRKTLTLKKFLIPLLLAVFTLFAAILLAKITKINSSEGFNLAQMEQGSARLWYFFLPSDHHPIFGLWIASLRQGVNYSTQTIYLGLVPLILSLIAILSPIIRKKFSKPVLFFTLLAVIATLFTLKPLVSIGRLNLPTLTYFLHLILPFMRSLTRFSLLIIISLSILSSFTLSYFSGKIKNTFKRIFLFLLIIGFIILEFLPSGVTTSFGNIPEHYQYLKNLEGDFIIAEYPFYEINPWVWAPMYYQTYHHKRLAGSFFQSPADQKALEFLAREENTSNSLFARYLQMIGVKYVLVHTKDDDSIQNQTIINKIKINDFYQNPLLSSIKKFPQAELFQINPSLNELYATNRLINISTSPENKEILDSMIQYFDPKWQDYAFYFQNDGLSDFNIKEKETSEINFFEAKGMEFKETNGWYKQNIYGQDIMYHDMLNDKPAGKLVYRFNVENAGSYDFNLQSYEDDGLSFIKYKIISGREKYENIIMRPGFIGKAPSIENLYIGNFKLEKGDIEIIFENIPPVEEKVKSDGFEIAHTGEEKEILLKKGVPENKIIMLYLYNGRSGIRSLRFTSINESKKANLAPNISFEKKSNSHYFVRIEKVEAPFFLVFLQPYSSNWKIYQNKKLIENRHFMANHFANGWYLDGAGNYEIIKE